MCRKFAVAGLALAIGFGAAPHAAERIVPPAVPGEISVPAGSKPFFQGHAIGTQNYFCALTTDGYKWLPIGPQATLFDAAGQQVATHFQSKNPWRDDALQATWQSSRDTSGVWATRTFGSIDPAFVAADAIEWLRLDVTGEAIGPNGGDKFGAAKYILRVNTVGGVAPSTPCSSAIVNTRRFVNYEADYFFFK